MLNRKALEMGEPLSREDISDAFGISEPQAREIRFALENIDVLQMRPEVIEFDTDETALLLYDVHSPYHDPLAYEAALSFAEKNFKITIIILGGDFMDCWECSDFIKIDKKSKVPLTKEVKTSKILLQDLRKRFPNAKIIYKKGNHENRIDRYIMQNAESLAGLIEDLLPRSLGFEELGIEYKTEVFKIGKLWILHGDEFPSGGGVQKLCQKAWAYIHDHFCMGHFHRTDHEPFSHIDRSIKFNTNSVGWLGSPAAATYAPLNKYNQGCAVVEFQRNGNFIFHNKIILCGEVF